jgi:glycosyltransferase involved in cell wall biosynthesis
LGTRKDGYRLAVLLTHPIEYISPFLRRLAAEPDIDLTVYYCSTHGTTPSFDEEFRVEYQWDVPLLDGYSYHVLKNLSPAPSLYGFWGLINPAIVPRLWRGKYDAILVHGYDNASTWLGYVGAWLSGTSVLNRGETVPTRRAGNWKRRLKRLLLEPLFRGTAAFLPIGTVSAEFYEDFSIPRERLFLTPYAVDNEFFLRQREGYLGREAEIKRDLGLVVDRPVILFTGKLMERKRPWDLLLAYERLPARDAVTLLYVGDGRQRGELEEYARRRGLAGVRFTGFVNQKELPKYYAVADIFVLPSDFESWGVVVNEAMLFHLPVVTTRRVMSHADLVRHGENGFVYEPGDVDSLAGHLASLVGDEGLRRRMGRRSSEIISGWDYEAGVRGVLRALRYAAGGNSAGSPSLLRTKG